MQAKKNVLMLLIAGALGTGCNVCEDLDARMCADLGPEDCALWQEQEMTFIDQAKTRPRSKLKEMLFGPDSQTCQSSGSDAVYPQVLEATKASLAAVRQGQAAVAAAEAAK